ncbi:hypothetical protein [Methylomonas lenta]|uniref:hypothetical protein n=1 Tax=Methylomonas lenta TaxID=980561 RepID=UPI0012F66AA7|nr:hypothetical protein [Methylomonas lenta]
MDTHPDDNAATKAFWEHYDKAEKITHAMVLPAIRWGEPSCAQINDAHSVACQ